MIVSDRVQHSGERYITLYVKSMHLDRCPVEQIGSSDKARVVHIWDSYSVEELIGEEGVAAAVALMPEELVGRPADDPYNVFEISGSIPEIGQVFHDFVTSLFESRPSGDDDVYDYWPGGFETAVEIAKDLDKLSDTTAHTGRLRTEYEAVEAEWDMDEFALSDYGL